MTCDCQCAVALPQVFVDWSACVIDVFPDHTRLRFCILLDDEETAVFIALIVILFVFVLLCLLHSILYVAVLFPCHILLAIVMLVLFCE